MPISNVCHTFKFFCLGNRVMVVIYQCFKTDILELLQDFQVIKAFMIVWLPIRESILIKWKLIGMGQAGFCPSQVKSSFFENQNFKLKYFSNIWISSLIKPSFFNYKIFKPSQAQISWVSSQVKSSIFNILIFKSNQVKLKLFDLTCQVAWTFFSKNLISIDLNWKNLYWNCKLT